MNTRFRWTDRTVSEALGLACGPHTGTTSYRRVSTDSRAVRAGDLFVALRGERFDGHDFVAGAVLGGARGIVVSRTAELPGTAAGVPCFRVHDTLAALGVLANHRRRVLGADVIAVTGSSGKTTVKELLLGVLRSSRRVHATRGNRNNRVGVPLTILEAPADAEVLILEVGTSEPGEIGLLTSVAQPDHAVVTTVSEAHLTGLGSLAGVLDEKLDLIRGAAAAGIAVVGDEPAELARAARAIRPDVRVAGLSVRADAGLRGRAFDPGPDGTYRIEVGGRVLKPGLPGLHGARNVLLALAVARLLGIGEDAAIAGASEVTPAPFRGEMRAIGGLTMILDCYNANPQSLAAALELLAGLAPPSRKVAVLGSMLELGERSGQLHRRVLEKARSLPLDVLVATGEFAAAAGRDPVSGSGSSPELVVSPTVDGGYEALRSRLDGTETVLLKGSRSVRLERLLPLFERDFGVPAAAGGG